MEEQPWEFSKAPTGTLTLAGLLGAANLAGATWLWWEIQQIGPYLERTSLAWLAYISPVLWVYGVLFLTVPAVRYFLLGPRNEQVARRNGLRRDQAVYLSRPDARLREKLTFAQGFVRREVLGEGIYDSGKAMLDQRDLDAEDFNRRLES
ncbi:hypothetical protein [Candidatus Cyanaurora vandensis]|uniref:hypothetical protein n=1 Tax=Candidatus Cyanaurora vandensis TaxID=2714958 RepID=UPI0025802747|nr:hypothetical protein [Candidatus Cyanaurora vandensis]